MNLTLFLDIGHLVLKDHTTFTKPIIIKPANLDFTEKNLIGDYLLEIEKGKVEKNYIIESKEPAQEALIGFSIISKDDEDKETPVVEIKVFADGKQIEGFNLQGEETASGFCKIIKMNKYF